MKDTFTTLLEKTIKKVLKAPLLDKHQLYIGYFIKQRNTLKKTPSILLKGNSCEQKPWKFRHVPEKGPSSNHHFWGSIHTKFPFHLDITLHGSWHPRVRPANWRNHNNCPSLASRSAPGINPPLVFLLLFSFFYLSNSNKTMKWHGMLIGSWRVPELMAYWSIPKYNWVVSMSSPFKPLQSSGSENWSLLTWMMISSFKGCLM